MNMQQQMMEDEEGNQYIVAEGMHGEDEEGEQEDEEQEAINLDSQ